jgi:hypothetical protein
VVGGEGAQGFDPVLGDHHHLAVGDVAHEAGADDFKGAGLGGQDELAGQFAQDQGADAQGVAHPDQLLVGERHQGIAAFDLADGVDEAVDDPGLPRAGDEVEDDLAVGGGLADRAVGHQGLAQGQEVGEVAVVGDGDAAAAEVGEHRLDVAQEAAARGGVAGVADAGEAGQALSQVRSGEGVGH